MQALLAPAWKNLVASGQIFLFFPPLPPAPASWQAQNEKKPAFPPGNFLSIPVTVGADQRQGVHGMDAIDAHGGAGEVGQVVEGVARGREA